MKKFIYSIYDEKAQIFCNPFTHINHATAERDFLHGCNDPAADIGRFPEDYTLYCCGEFDDKDGKYDVLPSPLFITKGAKR